MNFTGLSDSYNLSTSFGTESSATTQLNKQIGGFLSFGDKIEDLALLACKKGEFSTLAFLIKEDKISDYSVQDCDTGYTILHYIVAYFQVIPSANELINKILKRDDVDCFINIQDYTNKNTPLHFAAQMHNNELCDKLVKAGADQTIRNANNLYVSSEQEQETAQEQVPLQVHAIQLDQTEQPEQSIQSTDATIELPSRTFSATSAIPVNTATLSATSSVPVNTATLSATSAAPVNTATLSATSAAPSESVFLKKAATAVDNAVSNIINKFINKPKPSTSEYSKGLPENLSETAKPAVTDRKSDNKLLSTSEFVDALISQYGNKKPVPQSQQPQQPQQSISNVLKDRLPQLPEAQKLAQQLEELKSSPKAQQIYSQISQQLKQMGGGRNVVRGSRMLKNYNMYGGDFDEYDFAGGAKNRNSEASELSRAVDNQANKIHSDTIKKIQEILDVDEQTARAYKSKLWSMVIKNNPDLNNLDKSVEMLKLATKDVLRDIDSGEIKDISESMAKKWAEKQKRRAESSGSEGSETESSESSEKPKKRGRKSKKESDTSSASVPELSHMSATSSQY